MLHQINQPITGAPTEKKIAAHYYVPNMSVLLRGNTLQPSENSNFESERTDEALVNILKTVIVC
jgi:hypothetical protein